MSKTVFTKVDYNLSTLMEHIRLGIIGLPDIQRPFVWKNAKVRDLFDSMYKGYPVGYFLFWHNSIDTDTRAIGDDTKQKVPKIVIVDGQQRLTSLYAVVKNIKVIRENFDKENIEIAFDPLTEKFEVADAAIRRDKSFIPNISILWSPETDLFEVVDTFIENLKSHRVVSNDEIKIIRNAFSKLQGLVNYPFTALELEASVDEEAVADVFVRINSKGTPLNQADFILTLMSVFWDEGRSNLEDFCREARLPDKHKATPFNHFIEPSPAQLLRVAVGLAFKRGRLKYVYSILRGKDLDTGEFSDERRDQQFEKLKVAQEKVLNLTYWHDFMNCLNIAGFRSSKMISSENNLIFSYLLYLIGKTEYNVDEHQLKLLIARWFFMSSLTGRFTKSPESAMEFDLARLRNVESAEQFQNTLEHVCQITLNNDFWNVSLPNDLATSSPLSPSLSAYYAALVLLDAKALFSKIAVDKLIDPSIKGNKSYSERHHLFPKNYLKKLGIKSVKDTNQIANYALVEWGDNVKISDNAPIEYLPEYLERYNKSEIQKMYKYHALPQDWENMDYNEFLQIRRELIAKVIAEGYQKLVNPKSDVDDAISLDDLIETGESDLIEFKSTLRTNLHTNKVDPKMEHAVLKTIAGFINTQGGTLVIGVSDDGTPVGIEVDGFKNQDKMALHLVNIIKDRLGLSAMTNYHVHFDEMEESKVMIIKCDKGNSPVFTKDGDSDRFYIRTGPSTAELPPSQTQTYIKNRFPS